MENAATNQPLIAAFWWLVEHPGLAAIIALAAASVAYLRYREKAFFVASSVWFGLVVCYFLHARPQTQLFGPQTVDMPRLKQVEVTVAELSASNEADLKLFTLGPRPNPFNVHWYEDPGGITPWMDLQNKSRPTADRRMPPRKNKRRKKRRETVAKPPPKPPPRIRKPVKKPQAISPLTKTPRAKAPYEIPVEMRGWWVAVRRGGLAAIFRDKENGELLEVHEGDVLADFGITIIRVTRTGVLVENDKGDTYLIRDSTPEPPEE